VKEIARMIDEIFDRSYQAGRSDLNAGLAAIFAGIGKLSGEAFRVLHRIEFDAPWQARKQTRRHA
jgi:hypothetical protein